MLCKTLLLVLTTTIGIIAQAQDREVQPPDKEMEALANQFVEALKAGMPDSLRSFFAEEHHLRQLSTVMEREITEEDISKAIQRINRKRISTYNEMRGAPSTFDIEWKKMKTSTIEIGSLKEKDGMRKVDILVHAKIGDKTLAIKLDDALYTKDGWRCMDNAMLAVYRADGSEIHPPPNMEELPVEGYGEEEAVEEEE